MTRFMYVLYTHVSYEMNDAGHENIKVNSNVRRRVFGLAPGVPSLNPHRSGFYMCGDIVREVLQYGRWSETCARTRFSSVARPGARPGERPGDRPGDRPVV